MDSLHSHWRMWFISSKASDVLMEVMWVRQTIIAHQNELTNITYYRTEQSNFHCKTVVPKTFLTTMATKMQLSVSFKFYSRRW